MRFFIYYRGQNSNRQICLQESSTAEEANAIAEGLRSNGFKGVTVSAEFPIEGAIN
jgi:hypothetical protein